MLYTEPVIKIAKVATERSTEDGSPAELPLYVARPVTQAPAKRPAVLVLQEIFGVNAHIQSVTQRFAAAGYVAVAPDIFYRNGAWQEYGYEDMTKPRESLALLTEDKVIGDISAALAFVAKQPDVDPTRIGVVGFCFGGRMSFLTAARLPGQVKASAVFYGGGIVQPQNFGTGQVAPIDRAGDIRCPMIAFFGGLDKHIPADAVKQLDDALGNAGVNRQVYLYPWADHGFFCDARKSYDARAAQDAWQRVTAFFGAHLGPVPAVDWA